MITEGVRVLHSILMLQSAYTFGSYLSYKRVDAILVQFVKRNENRAMLGRFVWAYFDRLCGSFGCSCSGHISFDGNDSLASPILNAFEYTSHLLREISNPYFDSTVGEDESSELRCKCAIPPLYLQWEGHSITVVGIRKISNGNGQPPSFNLIVFDPQKKKLGDVKHILAAELSSRSGLTDTSKKFVNTQIHVPASKFYFKDTQIILSTARIIDKAESNRRKYCAKNIGYLDAKPNLTTT